MERIRPFLSSRKIIERQRPADDLPLVRDGEGKIENNFKEGSNDFKSGSPEDFFLSILLMD
jgi:hypothetical protein